MNIVLIQDQVLLGTILGGSSLLKPPKGVNYYISMRNKHDIWLKYKMAEMPSYFKRTSPYQAGNTFRCNSSCHESLTNIYDEVYDGDHRKITMDILNKLMDMGIAVWFLDNGGKTGRNKKNAYINTTKFGEDGTKIICQYFNEVDMPCNINRNGERLKVLFSIKGTEALFVTIAHRFPVFMYYRL